MSQFSTTLYGAPAGEPFADGQASLLMLRLLGGPPL